MTNEEIVKSKFPDAYCRKHNRCIGNYDIWGTTDDYMPPHLGGGDTVEAAWTKAAEKINMMILRGW